MTKTTTIKVDRDTTKQDLNRIKDEGGHTSMDSVIKSLINTKERVDALEDRVEALKTTTHFDYDEITAKVFDRLNLTNAKPLPTAVGRNIYGHPTVSEEDVPRLFRLFVADSWLLNAQIARDPEYVDVILTSDGFLLRHKPGFLGSHVGATEERYFFVQRDDYVDEIMSMLDGDVDFLLPPGGIPTVDVPWGDYRAVNVEFGGSDTWGVLGGYGQEVTEEQEERLLGLQTVDEAIRTAGLVAYLKDREKEQEFEEENEKRKEKGEPIKIRTGLHISDPSSTISSFMNWAFTRADWSPRADVDTEDLLPEKPVELEEESA